MNKKYINLAIIYTLLTSGSLAAAQEHGSVPIARSVYVDPQQPLFQTLVSSDLGLHLTWDGWETSYWVCEDIIGYDVQTFAAVGPAAADPRARAWLVGGPAVTIGDNPVPVEGLWRSVNGGCDWTAVGGVLEGQWATQLRVHPERPSEVLVATQHFEKPNGVAISEDAGVTWRWTGLEGIAAPLNGLVRAPSAPERLYASSARSLWRSDDGGLTWSSFGEELVVAEGDELKVQAVHPGDPDTAYFFLSSNAGRAVYATYDGGASSALLHQADTREEAALAAVPDGDGVALIMGTRFSYTWVLRADAEAWVLTEGNVPIECLVPDPAEPGALLVCSNIWAQFIPPLIALGRTDDKLESVAPLFTYGQTTDYMPCAADSQVNTICIPLDTPNPGGDDVGAPDADAGDDTGEEMDAGMPPSPLKSDEDSCGCVLSRGATKRPLGAALLAALCWGLAWRRSGRRAPR